MRRFLRAFLAAAIILYAGTAFAEIQVQNNASDVGIAVKLNVVGAATTRAGETVTVDMTTQTGVNTINSLGITGTATGGVSTMASGDTVVPLGYSVVKKYLGQASGQAGTLANGTKGQILKVIVYNQTNGGTFTVTPTTATGFTSFTLSAIGQYVTLLYPSSTVGWITIGQYNATITP